MNTVLQVANPPVTALMIPMRARVEKGKIILMTKYMIDALKVAKKAGATVDSWIVAGELKDGDIFGVNIQTLEHVLPTMTDKIEIEFEPHDRSQKAWLVLWDGYERKQNKVSMIAIPPYKLKGEPVYLDLNSNAEVYVPDPWIKKAIGNSDMMLWQQVAWGSFALDGFRIHYDPNIKFHDHAPRIELPVEKAELVVKLISEGAAFTNVATFPDKSALVKAVTLAKKYSTQCQLEYTKTTGKARIIATKLDKDDKKTAKTNTAIPCTYVGERLHTLISTKFLIDALSGMSRTREIEIRISDQMLHITDGDRIAIVMMRKPK